jgi:4-aminobutyrate aminotransferase/(S)-3-amino-2-methylpropionate transaminase
MNAGHCPEPVVKAIQEQAARLIHSCFNVSLTEPYLELAEKLVELFPHGERTKVMLTNSGTEAVENAIKIARMATGRPGILCFTGAFHGRTMMAMTLTAKSKNKTNCGPYAPEVYRIEYPYYYRYGGGMNEEAYIGQQIRRLKDFFYYQTGPEHIAAVILELVQGEGGFTVMPPAYLKALRATCDEHGILLIIDEVQSGFGRTGEWAAYQHYGITPDISTWAKSMGAGMPIGAVMGRADIMDAAKPGTIGGTYPGNPVCCAAALANIRYMEDIQINQKGQRVGAIVRRRMLAMKEKCPAIGNVRGLGAMLAFELVKNGDPWQPDADLTSWLVNACEKKGLVIISAGTFGNCIRVLSPLTIELDLLEKGLDILEETLLELTDE